MPQNYLKKLGSVSPLFLGTKLVDILLNKEVYINFLGL